MRDCLAVILAGGKGDRLSVLSEKRAKPAVPFGGKYRLIDFTLSNCSNSGVTTVAVITQYKPRSLADHIRIGKPWDYDRKRGGIEIISPYLGRKDSGWYKGTADAIYQNRNYLRSRQFLHDLILSGDHVYLMDYSKMYAQHIDNRADLTIATITVEPSEAPRYGILEMDYNNRVLCFEEKPAEPKGLDASMGIYIFNQEVLLKRLEDDAFDSGSEHDFGKNIIPTMIANSDRVFGYRYNGYWKDVGTLGSYFECHQDLLRIHPKLRIDDPSWSVYTAEDPRPPAKFGLNAQIVDSIVCPGCIIDGCVERSVISLGVNVEKGAHIKDSIIMEDSTIRYNTRICNSILDKQVVVSENCTIGYSDNPDNVLPNFETPTVLAEGLTVVGKSVFIPANIKIGKNVLIYPEVDDYDFEGRMEIESSETVHRRGRW